MTNFKMDFSKIKILMKWKEEKAIKISLEVKMKNLKNIFNMKNYKNKKKLLLIDKE